MERICQIGEHPDKYRFEDIRLESKGFLSILSYQVAGLSHRHNLMERGNAVVMLPADFKRRELYMIEQPRYNRAFRETTEGRAAIVETMSGMDTTPFEPDADKVRLFELPAGMIDADESPVDAAVRELKEETGLIVAPSDMTQVASFYPSLGSSTEKMTAFIARLPDPVIINEAHGDGGEQITVWKMSWDEAFAMLDSGKIITGSSAVLLRELKIIDITGKV